MMVRASPARWRFYAQGLRGPFGIAFYPLGPDPRWVYVGNLNSVVRFPYRKGDLIARGPAEVVVPSLAGSTGGHTTRDVAFSLDGRRMFISVGSGSNVAETMPVKSPAEIRRWEAAQAWAPPGFEARRANILETDPEGRQPARIFANGIRNAVGLAVTRPPASCGRRRTSATPWATTWCRTTSPMCATAVFTAGRGITWAAMKIRATPTKGPIWPATSRSRVPLQSHSASLQIVFYPAASGVAAFPAEYRGEIFAAFHGSWNRRVRTGSKVVRVRFKNGVPTGEYEDFLTGFVIGRRPCVGPASGCCRGP